MAKSMAASMTAAVRLGYDAACGCDSYGSHASCVPGGHTPRALEVLCKCAARFPAPGKCASHLGFGSIAASVVANRRTQGKSPARFRTAVADRSDAAPRSGGRKG